VSFNLRLFLVIIHAAFVLTMSVQSSLDAPHHYAPPAMTTGQQLDLDKEMQVSSEEASTSQCESETSVDHAMISPGGVASPPPQGAHRYIGAHDAGLPAGHSAATIERPPRAVLAA
jgi:hypothetical protein